MTEDLEVFMNTNKAAIEIHSGNVGLWFLGHELKNTNENSNGTTFSGRFGGAPLDHSGVRIASGTTGVYLYQGKVNGFGYGVATANPGANISRVDVRNMELGLNYLGIAMSGVDQPSIRHNVFNNCQYNIFLTTASDVVVADNRVLNDRLLSTATGLSYGSISLFQVNGGTVENNDIVSDSFWPNDPFSGLPPEPYPTIGIVTSQSQHVNIENNVITGMVVGIWLGFWPDDHGMKNSVRRNRIYGGPGNHYLPGRGYRIPASSDGFEGMLIRGQRDLVLHGNQIYSGWYRGYPTGFYVENTTFGVSTSGMPDFYRNKTCGTDDPVYDSALYEQVMKQNLFEACRSR